MYNQYGQPMYSNNPNIKPMYGGNMGQPINYFPDPNRVSPMQQQQIQPQTQIMPTAQTGYLGPPMQQPQIKPYPMQIPQPQIGPSELPQQFGQPYHQFDPIIPDFSQQLPQQYPSYDSNSGVNPLVTQMQQQRWNRMMQLGIPY